MDLPDFERIRRLLLELDDTEVTKLVRVLDVVFRSGKFRPLPDTLQRRDALVAAVQASFPTPFARKFEGWIDLDGELQDTLDQLLTLAPEARQRDRMEQRARLRFRNSLLEIETCWRQIVHFLPFILMATLRRLDDDALQRYAGPELAQALYYYNTFYGRYNTERQREADQLHLLVYLIRVVRQLRRSAGLDEGALFATAIGRGKDGFADLFPDRFDASMRLLQQVRNRVLHGRLADRLPCDTLAAVNQLVSWCFLDIIGVLEPICRTYSLDYVTDLIVGETDATAEALEFAGAEGPFDVRYRVSPAPQVEIFTFTRHRLYLILRGKRIEGGSGEQLVPQDYLDLTPFLIIDRLRAPPLRSTGDAQQRLLFALQQYLEPLRRLLFSDLGGSGDSQRPSDANDWEANRLLEQIQWFKDRINQLTAKVRVKTGAPLDLQAARAALWRISRENLAPLLDVRLYDERGELHPDVIVRDLKSVYNPDLFVEPAESGILSAFVAGDRRALLLVGGSGLGKSNLLIHHYRIGLRAGRMSVFLTGRRFDTADFRAALMTAVGRELARDWESLADLDGFLEETGETLIIFIDALNEYSGPRGALHLLASMISATNGEAALRRCRIVATCRSETWARYRQEYGEDRPLDPARFVTQDGDAVRVGGFADPERAGRLFDAYRHYYSLRPERYGAVAPAVRALIGQPFMMAIVAETYSNRDRPAEQPELTIPADLDYFAIFGHLTDRKARDAQVLVPAEEHLFRETLPDAIRKFCKSLAEIVFERLTVATAEDGVSGLDGVPLDVVDKRPALQEFLQRRGQISVLDATLQIGLVEQVRIELRDWEGRIAPTTALQFFHDQYTQYWLASAYQQPIIGWLDSRCLASQEALAGLLDRVRDIVGHAARAPVLAGALDHWLQRNLVNFHRRRLEPVMPFLDAMATDPLPAMRQQVVAMLAALILRGFLSPQDVFNPIFQSGSAQLCEEMVTAFVEFWPALPPASVQAFIDACQPDRHRAVLDKLGDVFVLHLQQDPEAVVAYLDQAIRPLAWSSIAEPMRIWRQSRFMQQFGVFGLMTSFDQPACLVALRQFFRIKYRPVIDLITAPKGGAALTQAARRAIRDVLFRWLEGFGVDQWKRFIAYMEESGNPQFFGTLDGVNQHDLLRALLPYLVELHNGVFDRLSLAPGSPFRLLLLRMLEFRVMSVIGYNAMLCLPSVLLRESWTVTEEFVMELIERRSASAVFYGNLLLANIAYSNNALAPACLALMRDRIVPLLLREGLDCDWSIAFCIATLDVDRLWPIQSAILDQLFDAAEASGDPQACTRFGGVLYKLCFTHDLRLGRKLVERLLDAPDRFLAARWRVATLTVFAAMLTRSPATLHALVRAAHAAESLVGEARQRRSPEIVEQSRLFPLQADINRFVAWQYVDEPRMRYAIIRHFIGSLACGRSIEDFAVGVRQTVVALMSVFLGDAPEDMPRGPLSLAEIEASVLASRRGRRRSRPEAA